MKKNMRRMVKKIVTVVITGVLTTVGVSGCGGTKTEVQNTKDNITKGVESEEKARVKENVAVIGEYVEQLVNEPQNNPADFSKGGFVWDTEKKSDSWRYFNGVMLDGFLMLDKEQYKGYVEKFYEDNLDEDGNIKDYNKEELDSVPAGLGLFYYLEDENAQKYVTAINYIYNQLEVQISYEECGGNYLHKPSWKDWHIGLDGLYMAQPFLMRCANAIDEGNLTLKAVDGHEVTSEEIYQGIYKRMYWVAENMYDETTQLYHHGWNATTNKGNGHFWGRGIGWYAVALVDVIDGMPEGDNKNQLIKQLPKLFDGMLKYQDEETGLWYNVVNQPQLEKNRLETSVSSMMSYALMKAYINDWVTEESYRDAGLKAFNSIVEMKITKNGEKYSVTDTYQKSGVETEDEWYVKNDYVADEGKGVGVLIMATALAEEAAGK